VYLQRHQLLLELRDFLCGCRVVQGTQRRLIGHLGLQAPHVGACRVELRFQLAIFLCQVVQFLRQRRLFRLCVLHCGLEVRHHRRHFNHACLEFAHLRLQRRDGGRFQFQRRDLS
jgi:hypothetical protein